MPYTTHADLGGRPDFGPVVQDAEDSVFHAAWESRVLALSLAMGATGCWNLDMFRAARETLPDYLDLSYYEIWLGGLEDLLVAKGLVTAEELAAQAGQPDLVGGSGCCTACKRLADGAQADQPRALPAWPTRRHARDAGRSLYAAARLSSWQHRHHRTHPRPACVCRFPCPRPRRRPSMALHGGV